MSGSSRPRAPISTRGRTVRPATRSRAIFPTDGAFAIPAPTAVIKGAPHPNAAKAFAEFMIGDAVQRLFPGEGIYAARSDVEPPPGNPPLSQIKLMPVDYEQIEKDSKALKTRFNDIFQ